MRKFIYLFGVLFFFSSGSLYAKCEAEQAALDACQAQTPLPKYNSCWGGDGYLECDGVKLWYPLPPDWNSKPPNCKPQEDALSACMSTPPTPPPPPSCPNPNPDGTCPPSDPPIFPPCSSGIPLGGGMMLVAPVAIPVPCSGDSSPPPPQLCPNGQPPTSEGCVSPPITLIPPVTPPLDPLPVTPPVTPPLDPPPLIPPVTPPPVINPPVTPPPPNTPITPSTTPPTVSGGGTTGGGTTGGGTTGGGTTGGGTTGGGTTGGGTTVVITGPTGSGTTSTGSGSTGTTNITNNNITNGTPTDMSGVESRLDTINNTLKGGSKEGLPSATPKSFGNFDTPGGKFYTRSGNTFSDAKHTSVFGVTVHKGNYYISDGTKTVSSSVDKFNTAFKQSPLFVFFRDFLKITPQGASCPVWHIPSVMSMQDMSISPLCSDFMPPVWSLVRAVLKILAALLAWRIAISHFTGRG